MKFSNFCGIFAIVFVTATIILLASCSQDDDYYESDMYTLAEMGTRLDGGGESGALFPLMEGYFTESVQWKRRTADSLGNNIESHVVTCNINLRVVYNPHNPHDGVYYDGFVNDTVFDANINGGSNVVKNNIHFWATLGAKYIVRSDTLPDETLTVIGYVNKTVSPTNFHTIPQ